MHQSTTYTDLKYHKVAHDMISPWHMCDDMQDTQAEKLQRLAGQAAAKAGGVPASAKVS